MRLRLNILAGFVLGLLGAFAAPAGAAYHTLEEIPVESRIVRDVEDLAASYGLAWSFHSTRPWDRADLGAFLDQILTLAPEAKDDPLVVRIQRELDPEAGGWDPMFHADDDRSSLELSPYLRANYADDRARHVIDRDFRGGLQASAMLGEHALVFADVYAGTESSGPHGNPTDSRHFGLVEGVQLNSYFDRAYARARAPLGRVTVGHSWLRWGPGVTGGVGLSDGSRAFDYVEFRTTFVKRVQLEWFVASLDPVAETYLAGHRLEVRPSQSLDVAFSELARFDGVANAPLYLVPVIPFSHLEKRLIKSSNLGPDSLEQKFKNNVMWTADFTWRARPGMRIYGELAVDDLSFSSEKRPLAIAWQVGAHWRRRFGDDALAVRGEYSRVYQFTYSVFHHHDFEFGGFPTGYPLGPDVEHGYGQAAWSLGADWTFALEGESIRKGEGGLGDFYVPGTPVPRLILTGLLEQDLRAGASVDWSPAAGLSLGATAGFARVRALGHVFGNDDSGPYGSTRCTVRW